jgi:uncharacterized membrane protein YphA (DoxX/SURF4 family)
MAKIIYSLVLPPILWLLCGGPSIHYAGNVALFFAVTVHLYLVIWLGKIFELVRGSAFTYGTLAQALSVVLAGVTLVAALQAILRFDEKIADVATIPNFTWGIIALSMLLTIAIPIGSHRNVSALPKISDRREFEDPTDGK